MLKHSFPFLPSYEYKIGVLGAGKVGKTSLVKAFFGQRFIEKHIPTVGDYYVHAINLEGEYYSTCIIDTAGSYSFPAMRRLAIETSHGFLVLYSIDNEKSFVEALRLLDEIFRIKTRIDSSCRRVFVNLVATKLDIENGQREFLQKRGSEAIKVRPWMVGDYMEISAKIGFRVPLAFHILMKNLVTDSQNKERKKGRILLTRKMKSYKFVVGKKKKKKRKFRGSVYRLLSCNGSV